MDLRRRLSASRWVDSTAAARISTFTAGTPSFALPSDSCVPQPMHHLAALRAGDPRQVTAAHMKTVGPLGSRGKCS